MARRRQDGKTVRRQDNKTVRRQAGKTASRSRCLCASTGPRRLARAHWPGRQERRRPGASPVLAFVQETGAASRASRRQARPLSRPGPGAPSAGAGGILLLAGGGGSRRISPRELPLEEETELQFEQTAAAASDSEVRPGDGRRRPGKRVIWI
jgi:hypothetical protein